MTFHVSKIARDTAPNLAFVGEGGGVTGEAHTATIPARGNAMGNAVSMGRLVRPEFRKLFVAPAPDHAASKLVFEAGRLSHYDSYASGMWNGGSLRAYRVSGGKLVETGTTAITATTIKILDNPHSDSKMVAANEASFIWSKPGYSRPGMTVYYAIAAVNAAGERSPWSAPVPFTFAAASGEFKDMAQNLVAAPKSVQGMAVNAAIPVPTGLTASGLNGDLTVRLAWNPVAMGVVVSFSYHPDMKAEESLTLADSSFVQAGDLLVLSKAFDHTQSKAQAISPRVWSDWATIGRFGVNGLTRPFNEDMPNGVTFTFMSEAGRDFVRVNVPAGVTHKVETYTHSGAAQFYYAVLDTRKTYRAALSARMSVAKNVNLTVQGLGVTNVPLAIGTGWTSVHHDFKPSVALTDGVPRTTSFTVTGPVAFDLERMDVTEAGLVPFMAEPPLHRALVDSGAAYIRDHAMIKTHPWTYRMEDALKFPGPCHINGSSVPQLLIMLKAAKEARGGAGVNPWLQIEGHMSDAENRMLGGYLCTTYDPLAPETPEKAGAALRVAHGQVAPWTTVFESFIIECGNEHWNNLYEFYNLPSIGTATAGELNAHLLDRLADGILGATGAKREQFRFYLGGWTINDTWNRHGAMVSRHGDLLGGADYNGGWDSGLTTALDAADPNAVFYTLANSSVPSLSGKTRPQWADTIAAACADASAGRARPIRPMHYEAGPGYALPGQLTPAQEFSQNRLMKSVASGTAMLDAFLINTTRGILSSDFFLIAPNLYWGHAAQEKDGGAYNPPFMWFCFLNANLVGETKLLDPLTAEPLRDPAGTLRGQAVRLYQIRRADGRRAVVAVNLDPTAPKEVKLRLKSSRRWRRHYMTGDMMTYNFTSETRDAVAIRDELMPAGWGAAEILTTIQPGMAQVYIEEAA